MANYNPRLVKINRNYSYEELAGVFGVHKNTVANWVKKGLPCLQEQRPFLILGRDARIFLEAQRKTNKRKCKADELYCVACKRPSKPVLGLVDYLPLSPTTGRLTALCDHCDGLINKFASYQSLVNYKRIFDVSVLSQEKHIKR